MFLFYRIGKCISERLSYVPKVTQLVNTSIKYLNSILSNSKTYVLKPVVPKLGHASESAGRLVKIQIAEPHLQSF